MDLESIELSRERAVSSEPCSTRPNPFNDSEPAARKRQRVSSGSRSRSVDTATASSHARSSKDSSPETETGSSRPHTPVQVHAISEPTSSKVTINLRNTKGLDPSTPPSLSPYTLSKMENQDHSARSGTGPVGDSNTAPAETPSSTSSSPGSPKVELIIDDDGDGDYRRSPPVAIIDEDDVLEDSDPVLDFPYAGPNETLAGTSRKIARYFEYGETIYLLFRHQRC
jgi:ubiquitin carboxyl-terminal hydrolase 34